MDAWLQIKLSEEFKNRNCKIIGISVDTISDHQNWKNDIRISQGFEVNYPLIADPNLEIAKLFNVQYQTTLLIFKDNKEVYRSIGETSKDLIYKAIKSSLKS